MIRLAKKEDWPLISEVSKRSGYEDYINYLGPAFLDEGEVLVYEDTRIRAFTKIEHLPDNSIWLSGLRVDPDYWRKGIGTMLTDASIERGVQKGCTAARLLIYEDNFRSLRLAEKGGFVRIEKFDFFEGVPDTTGFTRGLIETDGLVNLGWKFMMSAGPHKLTAESYEEDGWKIISTNERTFQICSMGRMQISFKEGGFTCARSSLVTNSLLNPFKIEGFSSGFVLEKRLK